MRARHRRLEWLALGAGLLLVGALLGVSLFDEHEYADARERDRLSVQAQVIAANLGHQLEGVNFALAAMRDDFLAATSESAGLEVSRRLQVLSDAMPSVRTMIVTDSQGTVLASDRGVLIGMNFSQREYFTIARADANPDTLYVSPPFETVLGVYSINLARVLIDAKGAFAGIVAATLDPHYFDTLLRSVLYAPDMWASLAHQDGKVFLFAPPNNKALGLDLDKPGSFRNRHLATGQVATVMTGTVYATGEERMMARRIVSHAGLAMDKTLAIAASRDLATIFLPWRQRVVAYGLLWVLLAAAASFGLFVFQSRREKQDRQASEHRREQRESAERLELAVAGADLGLWEWHVRSDEAAFNARWCARIGYSPDELARNASTWRDRIHPDDWPELQANLERHLEGATPFYHSEHRIRHKDGHWVWVLGRGKVVERDASGAPVRMAGTQMDITERKLAEQDLRASEAQFRTLAEEDLAGVVIIQDARFKYVNPAMTGMIGYTRAELLEARTVLEFVIEDDRALVADKLGLRESGEVQSAHYYFRCRRKNGSIADLEALGTSIPFDGRFAVMSTVLDITDRTEAEKERQHVAAQLRNAYRRLAQAQEAERRAVAKELHDEVGQNLSALNLNLHSIRRELPDELRTSLHGRLEDSLILLDETVARVRSVMGSLRPPMLDEYGLHATLRWLAHETAQRSGIACTLSGTELAARLPSDVEATLLRIAQEALMNAVKYSKASEIRIALSATQHFAEMEIADDGVGFLLSDQNVRVAKPTWGLLTMRERADSLRGKLSVESAAGGGTRVVAQIPLA